MPGRLAAALLYLVASTGGCAAARSDCMRPVTDALPVASRPDAAVVVFARHEGSAGTLYTVMDEEKRFVGESAARSRFSVALPPGEHVFVAWDNRGPGDNAFTFEVMGARADAPDLPPIEPLQATLSRGKVYFVEVEPSGTLRRRAPSVAGPALETTTAFAPDIQRGQAALDRAPMRLERIRQRAIELLAGYRYGDVAIHTLRASDGR